MIYDTPDRFLADMPPHSRLLGLDVGSKTIGLALSDTMRHIGTPLLTIKRTKFQKDAAALQEIVAEHEISGLVIGLPLNMDGTEGKSCQSIRQFGRNILKINDISILFWDERCSTLAVSRALHEADLSWQKSEKAVDKMAASYILQGFLDHINHKRD